MYLIKNFFYILLVVILYVSFIFTNTYYLFVIASVLFLIYLISWVCMFISFRSIKLKVDCKENLKVEYNSNSNFPLGSMCINLELYNLFFEETIKITTRFIVGNKLIYVPLDTKLKLGNYQAITFKCTLHDMLNLHSKKIKNLNIYDFIEEPRYKYLYNSNELQMMIREKHSQESEDYDIREYKIGDSIKDIHYKISYKLSKLMVKEKIKSTEDITVYLDLSGDEEECEQVFTYLHCFIETLYIIQRKCNIYWHSKSMLRQMQISNIEQLPILIEEILSSPKASIYNPNSTYWIITSKGIFGGDEIEK